jgi:sugar phosphate isomerase/epimerase
MSYDPGRGFNRTRGGKFRRATIFGQGVVPVYQILKSLKAFGYEGYISLEYEGMEETIEAMEIGAENLKRMLLDIEK